MYHVQIEVTTQQSERIHLERESYRKAEECRLFSRTASAVATIEADIAARRNTEKTGTQTSRSTTGHQWDMVCVVDRLPMESGEEGMVWRV